jgi:aminoglycoside phosphotransferase (APT) family kinase protein
LTVEAAALRDGLRLALGLAALDFAEPPKDLTGGFDTRILTFRLSGAPAELSGPLVLRLFGARHDAARIRRERALHAALVELGYPVPRILASSDTAHPLGAPFLLMPRIPGQTLPDQKPVGMGGVLAEWQARLHDLDGVAAVRRALAAEGLPAGTLELAWHLDGFGRQLARPGLEGLRAALEWLRANQPPAPARLAICHGDFHPLNLLADRGGVTGILDWPNALLADATFDVAATTAILRHASVGDAPFMLRVVVTLARPLLIRGYQRAYRRRRALDAARWPYYEALALMRMILRSGHDRLDRRPGATGAAGPPDPMGPAMPAIVQRFAAITGVRPVLPGAEAR